MELSRAATTDPLTGVPNRRAWEAALTAALASAGATGSTLSVALLDLDGFKAVNDREGHLAGDRVLKGCAAAWRAQLRPTDVLARVGEDEFALLLPGCGLAHTAAVRERFEQLAPHAGGVSVGVAEWEPGEPAQDLVHRAGRDLHERRAARR